MSILYDWSSDRVIGEIVCVRFPYNSFEWTIPDYFSQTSVLVQNKILSSPFFSYSNCEWRLKLSPKELHPDWISLFLLKKNSGPAVDKSFRFSLAVKKSDGTLEREINEEWKLTFGTNNCDDMLYFLANAELQKRKSELAPSGAVTFACCFEVEMNTKEVACPAEEKAKEPSSGCVRLFYDLEALTSDFSQFFFNKEKCDVTVRVQDKEFQAHRAVLMARSPVFRAMFVHDTKEAQEGILNEQDCDPDSFGEFLQYLYTGQLEDVNFRDAHQLYITSDKYDVPKLKSSCVAYMLQNLTAENFCEVAVLGDRFEDGRLASAAETFFVKNFRDVLRTDEWKKLLRTNYQLVDRLLEKI